MNKLHTRRRAKNERKNDQSNWIRAFILIFIMASSQTYFSHLPSNYVSDEWAENVDLMSHDAKHEIVMETTKKTVLDNNGLCRGKSANKIISQTATIAHPVMLCISAFTLSLPLPPTRLLSSANVQPDVRALFT